MDKYIISCTADYNEYMLRVSFIMPFSDENAAKIFADRSVDHIELQKCGIIVVTSDTITQTIRVCGDFVFKRLKDKCLKAAPLSVNEITELRNSMTQSEFTSFIFGDNYIIGDDDYEILEKDVKEVFTEMCRRYGNREYFVFSISSFSVKKHAL